MREDYYNQNPYGRYEPMEPEQPKRSITGLIIIIFLIFLVVVIASYLFMQPAEKITAAEKAQTAAEKVSAAKPAAAQLTADIMFASFIDENFNYGAQPSAEYTQDEGVYLYIEVAGFNQDKNYNVDISEDLEIKDSNGKTAFAKKNLVVLQQKYTKKIGIVRFKNIVSTIGWKPGKYFARIIINDNLAKKSIEKIMEFSIKEKSKEIIEKTIDLSKIVSENIAKTQLIKQQTVWDPNGNIIDELSLNQTVAGDLSTVDLSNIAANIKIPERFDAGAYTVEIRYINLENGKSVYSKETINVVKQLAIDQFVFASSIDKDYFYEVQPNAVYKAGADVYVYLRLVDFAQPAVNGKFMVNFTEDVFVLDKNGNEISSKKNYLTINNVNDIKRDNYNIKNSFGTNNMFPDSYIYKTVIKDLNSGQEAVREEAFKIE